MRWKADAGVGVDPCRDDGDGGRLHDCPVRHIVRR